VLLEKISDCDTMPAAGPWQWKMYSFFAGSWFFHVELCSQVGLRDRARDGARGIYCALGRSAGDNAERPAECAMHHAWDNSSEGSDSFRCGLVFPRARQLWNFNEVRPPPASTALYLPLLVTARLSGDINSFAAWLLKKLIGGLLMFTVLSFGYDRHRLLSRHKVLVAAGFRVTSMDNRDDVLRLLKSHPFHVLVIGHLVPMEDRNEIASQGKFMQNARVIFLYKGRITGTEMADAVLSVDGSPEDLNSTILWLVRGNAEDVERSTNAV
jgi:hypothetical protein